MCTSSFICMMIILILHNIHVLFWTIVGADHQATDDDKETNVSDDSHTQQNIPTTQPQEV